MIKTIAFNFRQVFWKLRNISLGFLNADNIGIRLQKPIQKSFLVNRPDTVYIPRDDSHGESIPVKKGRGKWRTASRSAGEFAHYYQGLSCPPRAGTLRLALQAVTADAVRKLQARARRAPAERARQIAGAVCVFRTPCAVCEANRIAPEGRDRWP